VVGPDPGLASRRGFVPDLSPYDTVSAMAQAVLDLVPPRFSLVGFGNRPG
jgi:hypothetical protein